MDPYTARLFQIESGGNPDAVTGSNRGLGQFGPAEEKQFGITDWKDPNQQAAAVSAEAQAQAPRLASVLGRPPTPGELYLTHQQGIAGGPALLSADPNTPAWQAIRPFYKSDAMAQKAITGNIPRGSPLYGADPNAITAGGFTGYWKSKFEGGMSGGAPTQAQDSGALLSPASMSAAPPPNLPLFGAPAGTPAAAPSPATQAGNFFASLPASAGAAMPQQQQMIQAPPIPMPQAPNVDMSALQAFLRAAQQPFNSR